MIIFAISIILAIVVYSLMRYQYSYKVFLYLSYGGIEKSKRIFNSISVRINGKLLSIRQEHDNWTYRLDNNNVEEIKIDQNITFDGVKFCLKDNSNQRQKYKSIYIGIASVFSLLPLLVIIYQEYDANLNRYISEGSISKNTAAERATDESHDILQIVKKNVTFGD